MEFRPEEAEKIEAELIMRKQIQIYNLGFPQNEQPPPPLLSTQMSPIYGFPRSVPPSVYPTYNVTSRPLRPSSIDDSNLL